MAAMTIGKITSVTFILNGPLLTGAGQLVLAASTEGVRPYPNNQNASANEAFLGLTFTWQGRRTEKLQSGRWGMLRRVSMIQCDATRRTNTNAAAAAFDLIRCRYSSIFASSVFRRKGMTLLELADI
jgi:hypothetical protein